MRTMLCSALVLELRRGKGTLLSIHCISKLSLALDARIQLYIAFWHLDQGGTNFAPPDSMGV